MDLNINQDICTMKPSESRMLYYFLSYVFIHPKSTRYKTADEQAKRRTSVEKVDGRWINPRVRVEWSSMRMTYPLQWTSYG